MRLLALILVLSASAFSLPGCSKLPGATAASPGDPPPAIAEIVASFHSYKPMTSAPVPVNPEVSMLCISVGRSGVIQATQGTKGPHAGMSIMVYMNDAAVGAFAEKKGSYPPGAIIVKEKHSGLYRGIPNEGRAVASELPAFRQGVGGMVKRAPGFDPEHGDWEYFYFEDSKKIEAGAIASCVKCHEGARTQDYVFGTWAPHPELSKGAHP